MPPAPPPSVQAHKYSTLPPVDELQSALRGPSPDIPTGQPAVLQYLCRQLRLFVVTLVTILHVLPTITIVCSNPG